LGQPESPDITRILLELGPDHGRSDLLYEAVYAELRRLAGGLMQRERIEHTLQPTALVNEAFLKLVDQSRLRWQNRAHFFGTAARAMRQVLVDHARRHLAQKRGGDRQRITLTDNIGIAASASLDVLAVHDALEKLAQKDHRMAKVVELRIFADLTGQEIAHVLDVSPRTVESDWKVAKMWLSRELSDTGDG
jgi:RNA polymerase sigma factor (TIGR02999 family)